MEVESTMLDVQKLKNLSIEQRLSMIETIQQTIIEEIGEPAFDAIDNEPEEDEEEIKILEERLADYKANPASFIKWDDFFDAEMKRLKGAQR